MSGRTYESGQISYEKLYIFDEENRDIPLSAKSAMIQAMEQNDPVGIIAGYYDEKLTIWAAGSFFLENLGYSIENFRELTGGSLLKIIMDDSAYPFSPEAFRKMQGKTEYYMLTREGAPLFLRTVKSEAQDQHGRALWVLSTRISRSSQNLSLINGLVKTGSWSIDYDLQGQVKKVKWGNSFRRMIGFATREEFSDTLEAWENRIHPDERLQVMRSFREIAGRTDCDRYDVEYRMMLKNGEYQWFRTNAHVIRRMDGTVDSLVGVIINTDQKNKIMRENNAMDQMIQGVVRLVERFAVCDLECDRYEYFEKDSRMSFYKSVGTYSELLEDMDEKFVVLKNNSHTRMSDLLSVAYLRDVLRQNERIMTFEYRTLDKCVFRMLSIVPIEWKDGVLTKTVMIAQDVGQKYEYENLANTDALTGLYNRRYLEALLKAWRERGTKFALFFLDLDRFKKINDTYGHRIGDELLSIVGRRLKGCICGLDEVFRIGGDEFALMIASKGRLDGERCSQLMQRLQKVVSRSVVIDGMEIHARISCGYAIYPDDSISMEELQIIADRRMYDNKAKHERELLGN